MTNQTDYWALVRDTGDPPRVRTLLRRRHTLQGSVDEILRSDGAWHTTGILVLHDLNMYENPLRVLTADEAQALERQLLDSRRRLPRTSDT